MTVLQRRKKPTHKKIAITRRFCPNLCVISLPIELFRRLNALFNTLCVQNVVFDCSAASKQAHTHANRNHSSILSKFVRYFSPIEIFLSDRDISSFKRSFHCIMRADRSVRAFQRKKEPTHKQIAIIRRFCPNLCVISLRSRYFVV